MTFSRKNLTRPSHLYQLIALLVMLAVFAAGCTVSQLEETPKPNPYVPAHTYNIGFTEYVFEDISFYGVEEDIEVAFWYPTKDQTESYEYDGKFLTEIAPDGQIYTEDGPYPMVIYNHGYGADQYQALYLKELLASEGYIVAAPKYSNSFMFDTSSLFSFSEAISHIDNDAPVDSFVSELFRDSYVTYLENNRIFKAEATLDEILNCNNDEGCFLYRSIDTEAIGMAGHSLGGITTIGVTGGHPNDAMLDERIKAAAFYASPSYPFEKSIASIAIPSLVMVGEMDTFVTKPDENKWLSQPHLSPPYFFITLEGANHFSFSNNLIDDDETIAWNRAASELHDTIANYTLSFFDLYLLGNGSLEDIIAGSDNPIFLSFDYEMPDD